MGTRSLIGIYNEEDGSVTASYCHFDGYLCGVGETLVKSYSTPQAAKTVACGGYMSSLEDTYEKTKANAVNVEAARTYNSVGDYMTNGFDDSGADYLYIFDGVAWFFCRVDEKIGFEEVAINLEIA